MTTTTSRRQAGSRQWLGATVLLWAGLAATVGSQGCGRSQPAADDAKTGSPPAPGGLNTDCDECARTVVFYVDPDPGPGISPCVEMFPTDLKKVSKVTVVDKNNTKESVICFLNHTGCEITVTFEDPNKGLFKDDVITLKEGKHEKPTVVPMKILGTARTGKYEFSWGVKVPSLTCTECPRSSASPSIIIHP